jgi:beta propeller repeat protein
MDSRKTFILLAVTVAILMASGGPVLAQSCGAPRAEAEWFYTTGEYKPQAWDDTLVYSWYDQGAYVIMARDLDTGDSERVSPGSSRQWDPDIHGDLIVWEDDSGADSDIVVYDRIAREERRIKRTGSQYSPAIWGTTLVYEDFVGHRMNLSVFDLATGEARRLPIGPVAAPMPDIYEDRIVYAVGGDIHLYDLASGTDEVVIDGPGRQDSPSIWGDTIVYTQWDSSSEHGEGLAGGLGDIRRRDLGSGMDVLVAGGVGTQYSPCVWPDRVAFEEYPVIGGASVAMVALERPVASAGARPGATRTIWSVTQVRELAMRPHPRPAVPVFGRGYVHVCEPHAAPAGRWALAGPAG